MKNYYPKDSVLYLIHEILTQYLRGTKQAIEISIENGSYNRNLLQIKLNLGYHKAEKLIKEMKNLNIIKL